MPSDRRDVIVYGVSAKSKNFQSKRFKKRRPAIVCLLAVFCEMSPPINFHNKFGAMAVKVRDVIPYRLLSLEAEGKLPKPAVPEASLLVSHVMTEFAGMGDEIGLVMVKVWMGG